MWFIVSALLGMLRNGQLRPLRLVISLLQVHRVPHGPGEAIVDLLKPCDLLFSGVSLTS